MVKVMVMVTPFDSLSLSFHPFHAFEITDYVEIRGGVKP
jgi:hypothetical protein